MFKKNLKRFVAILMTAAMVIGSSAMAYADPQFNDAGDVEGWVNKKIFTVLVPTASANALKMLIDPQKLIKDTAAAAKAGLSANDFDDATVLFPRTTGDKKYSNTSETISMANVGTVSVNYTITVGIADLGEVVLSDNKTTLNNTTDKAVLFIEMLKGQLPGNSTSGVDWAAANGQVWSKAGEGGQGTADSIVISENKTVALSADVVPSVKTLYKVSWNSADKYTYGIPKTSVSTAKINAYTNNDGLFKTSFTGTTNNGDLKAWETAATAKPKLTLTYAFEAIDNEADPKDLPSGDEEEEETINGGVFYDAQSNKWWIGVTDAIGFPADATISSVKVNGKAINNTTENYDGKKFAVVSWADYCAAGYDQQETVFNFAVVVNGKTYVATHVYQ